MVTDSTWFPKRQVVSRRPATDHVSVKNKVAEFLKLNCGHEVGLRHGYSVPAEVGCYSCAKQQEKQNVEG